jgi:protein-S-isoprenylcysteine O-methyltransferase Ste14
LFSLFALHHSLLARGAAKALLSRVIPDRLNRSTYVWVASLLLVLVCVAWKPIGGGLYRASFPLSLALLFIQLTGVWLIAQAVRVIDPLELAGIHAPSASGGLQTGGPYALVRHPLYLGWILVVFGTPHMTGDRLLFATISSLYLLVAVRWEERSLEQAFGEAYGRYKQQVTWRILPYLY